MLLTTVSSIIGLFSQLTDISIVTVKEKYYPHIYLNNVLVQNWDVDCQKSSFNITIYSKNESSEEILTIEKRLSEEINKLKDEKIYIKERRLLQFEDLWQIEMKINYFFMVEEISTN